MDYDVLILGGGIIGCAVAYELSKYSLNVALIEKDYDIADDVAPTNTSIVYDGVESDDTLMAKLELMGNTMFDEITSKFNIPFKRCGSLIIAEGKSSQIRLEAMYNRAIRRGIEYVRLLKGYEIRDIEPNISEDVKLALYSPNTGVVCPYDLAIAYGEVAFDNGVIFRLEEEVLDIEKISKGVKVTTNKNKFTCRIVVNTTPGENYSIDMDKKSGSTSKKYLNYYIMGGKKKKDYSNIILSLRENDDELHYVNSLLGHSIASVKTDTPIGIGEALDKTRPITGEISEGDVDSYYVSPYSDDVLIIDDSFITSGYVKVTGNHYAEVSMTPSVARMVSDTIVANLNCKLRKDFTDRRREFYRFKELSKEEKNKVISMDKRYGNIVCLCHQVTEGEIVDSIRRPLGARTVEGVKRRTGVTLGSCKGSYCLSRIIFLLARETDKQITDIVKDSKKSKLIVSRIKEFDSM